MDGATVSQAVALWLGWKQTSWPQPDEQRVVGRLGADEAAAVMPLVLAWHRDFYESDPFSAGSLVEMGDQASARFRALHPEATDEAVHALAWAFTWDYK
ncbi:MAG TPA: hypothetical protein VGB75_14425 [Jatrophihabitans sp.]|uniref:hypothetical protein n=1 Tax=Jatrophihabitans sp. TaxID=1932789 RepID=UPI002F173A07